MVPIGLLNGRRQMVVVDSTTSQLGEFEIRDVWTVSYEGATPPDADVLEKFLSVSAKTKIGSFELHKWTGDGEEGRFAVIFNAKVPAELGGDQLRAVVFGVAQTADEMESQTTGADKF